MREEPNDKQPQRRPWVLYAALYVLFFVVLAIIVNATFGTAGAG